LHHHIIFINYYFGANRNKTSAIKKYKMFGIHTAISGERLPLVANVLDTCKNKMYEEAPAALGLNDTTRNFTKSPNVFL
jgi:hypothetical protein